MRRNYRIGACIAALLVLAACGRVEQPRFTLTNYDALPGWPADDHAAALAVFRNSCVALEKLPSSATLGKGALATPASTWQATCQTAEMTAPEQARAFFEAVFTPFRVVFKGKESGLFTGYYEPVLQGARTRHGAYQTPVYRLPPDLKPGVPYLNREEIDRGALAGQGLEIVWVDDPVGFFFLQVQGSGRVNLENGEQIRIAYAGKNNQPYVALGKLLVAAGELPKDQVTLFTIRAWLRAHPEDAQALLWQNPSYTFFKEMPADGEPPGAERVALTPERSLAIDAHFYPYGLPLYLETQLPDGQAFQRLMIAQDTGGAIRGGVRGDVYFGGGERAEWLAGMMQAPGVLSVLVPNALAERLR